MTDYERGLIEGLSMGSKKAVAMNDYIRGIEEYKDALQGVFQSSNRTRFNLIEVLDILEVNAIRQEQIGVR